MCWVIPHCLELKEHFYVNNRCKGSLYFWSGQTGSAVVRRCFLCDFGGCGGDGDGAVFVEGFGALCIVHGSRPAFLVNMVHPL